MKTRITVRFFCVLALLAVAVEKLGAQTAPVPAGDAIVTINGRAVTRTEVARNVEMLVYLFRQRNPKVGEKEMARYRKGISKRMPELLAQRVLYETKLMTNSIVCPPEIRARVEGRFTKNFAARKQDFAGLLETAKKGGFEAEFTRNVTFDMKMDTLLNTVFSNEVHATDADVARVRADVDAYNARANATNALSWACGTNLVARARAGESFAALADKYSVDEERNPGGDLGDCDENDFMSEPNVWAAISRTPTGGVTDVLELEDGYGIFKVVARHSAKESTTTAEAIQLARIFLHRAYVYPEQSDESFRADVEEEKREEFIKGLFERLRKESTIVKSKKGDRK